MTLEGWRNPWFHSGDLACLDEDGDPVFVARTSERIRVKGEMVSGYEIEEVVMTHPAVTDCAVIGVPDGIGEEQVKVFATRREGAVLSLQASQSFCRTCMSRFMAPTVLEVLAETPRTPTGKPAKADLRKLHAVGAASVASVVGDSDVVADADRWR